MYKHRPFYAFFLAGSKIKNEMSELNGGLWGLSHPCREAASLPHPFAATALSAILWTPGGNW